MSNKLLFGPDQGWSLEPVATWLYTEGRRLRDAAALVEGVGAQLSISLPAAAAGDCLIIAKALVEADAGRSAVPPADLEGRIARAIYGYLTVAAPLDRLTLHSAAKPRPTRARRSAAKAATGAARRRGHAA